MPPNIELLVNLFYNNYPGYEAVVIEDILEGDMLDAIEGKITELGAEKVTCVLTTTSCFAPRYEATVFNYSQ